LTLHPGRAITPNGPPRSRRLRARTTAGLAQQQLAERLKTDQANIARLENSRTQAKVSTLKNASPPRPAPPRDRPDTRQGHGVI
jgi:hypothetical protein